MPPNRSRRGSSFTGRTLGRCVIGEPIGRGATATVFRAHYTPLKRDVAAKILRPDAAGGEAARAKFIEEARALARLDHENVVRVFDVVEDQGLLLIIMDLVPGDNLLDIVTEDGPLDPPDALRYARQIAEALAHAHQQKILHRDVKPANVLLDPDQDRVVLVDFGNAERVGEEQSRKGTAHYMAPEVFQGKRQDEKSDTYSLGATLFHLLTGEPPYRGQSVAEILQAHEAGKLRAPSAVAPHQRISKEVDALVRRAMAPARGYRYLAHEFAAAIDDLGSQATTSARPKGRRRRSAGARGRSSGPGAGLWLGIGGVAALALVAVALARGGGSTAPAAPSPAATGAAPSAAAAATPTAAAPGIPDVRIDRREEGRHAREEAARTAFREAEAFESKTPADPVKIAERWAAVATEYGELAEGRRARAREREWRDRAESAAQREEREKAAAAARERREKELALVDRHVAAMEFDEAMAALQRLVPPSSEEAEWARRIKRVELLQQLKESLSDGIAGNPVPLSKVRAGLGVSGEEAVDVGESGLSVRGAGGAMRMIPWSTLTAEDVLALGREVVRSTPEPRLALAAWAWERGLRREAQEELMNAVMLDRTGTVRSRAVEAFGEL